MTHTVPGSAERQLLREKMPTLSPRQRVAFAAACAERMLPLLVRYFGSSRHFELALERAWRFAAGEAQDEGAVQELVDAGEALLEQLYERDDRDYPMYATKSMISAATAILSASWEAAADTAFDAQDAAGSADFDHRDQHIANEARWQVQALEVALADENVTRDSFEPLRSRPAWLVELEGKRFR